MKWLFRVFFCYWIVAVCSMFVGVQAEDYGAVAAKNHSSLTIEQMLRYAIEDEYLAQAEYTAIIKQYGEVKPFINIVRAENHHIALLVNVYQTRGIAVPENTAAQHVVAVKSLANAMAIGYQAELDNIAMYQQFLANPLLNKPENEDVKVVFTMLMQASEKHLQAFQNGLSRYE